MDDIPERVARIEEQLSALRAVSEHTLRLLQDSRDQQMRAEGAIAGIKWLWGAAGTAIGVLASFMGVRLIGTPPHP